MKKNIFLTCVLLGGVFFSTCGEDDDEPTPNDPTPEEEKNLTATDFIFSLKCDNEDLDKADLFVTYISESGQEIVQPINVTNFKLPLHYDHWNLQQKIFIKCRRKVNNSAILFQYSLNVDTKDANGNKKDSYLSGPHLYEDASTFISSQGSRETKTCGGYKVLVDENGRITVEEIKEETKDISTNLLATYICSSDILDMGNIIVSYTSEEGEDIKRTLTESDFRKGTGENVATNIKGTTAAKVESNQIYWQMPLNYNQYDIENTIQIQFQPTIPSFSFTSQFYFSVRTTDRNEKDVSSYDGPIDIETINNVNIGSNEFGTPFTIHGYKVWVDKNGIISAEKI